MKRKMIGTAAGYMSGSFFAFFFSGRSAAAVLVLTAAVLIAGAKLKRLDRYDLLNISAFFAAAVIAGTAFSSHVDDMTERLGGGTDSFSGKVTDITEYTSGKGYILKGTSGSGEKLKLYYYSSEDASFGDIVSMERCVFTVPVNDFLCNEKDILMSEGIYLKAEDAESVSVEHTHSHRLKNSLYRYRRHIIKKFCDILGEDAGGMLSGMVFGVRLLSAEDRTYMYRSGIGHVLAVSGLHISIIAAAVLFLMKKAGAGKYFSFISVNIVMLLFISMAGSPVSAVRAAIMTDTILAAAIAGRQADILTSLCTAVMLICIFQPYAVYSTGFILSAAGTFGIGSFAPLMIKEIPHSKKLKRNFLTGLYACIAIMPVTMHYFDEVSLISPLTFVLLLPLCTAAIIAGAFCVLTGGIFTAAIYTAGIFVKAVMAAVHFAGKISIIFISCGDRRISRAALIFAAVTAAVWLITFSRRKLMISLTFSAAAVVVMTLCLGAVRYSSLSLAVLGNESDAAAVISCRGEVIVCDITESGICDRYTGKYLSRYGIDADDAVHITDSGSMMLPDGSQVTAVNGGLSVKCASSQVTIFPRRDSICVRAAKTDTSGSLISVNDIYITQENNYELVFSGGRCRKRRL